MMFREMRRIRQQATEEECLEILKSAKRGVLAVHGDDDYPYTVPMDFVYEDGCLYFHAAKSGHKLDAVRRNDKVSFCVLSDGVKEENDWFYRFTSVIVFGRMSEVTGQEEAYRCLRMLGMKYMPTVEMVDADMEKNAARAAVLKLRIEHMTGKHVKES